MTISAEERQRLALSIKRGLEIGPADNDAMAARLADVVILADWVLPRSEPRTPAQWTPTLQARVGVWVEACFGDVIAGDRAGRNHRFLEEALELVQACGASRAEAYTLVDYVYGRPAGAKAQEVGGVMLTLAALCLANDLDMDAAGEAELARVWTKIDQIRAKQAAKPRHSPLPA